MAEADAAAEAFTCQMESRVMVLRCLEITGGNPLCGEITVQGSKNAALPILAACMLGDGPCIIRNCPCIRDIRDVQILMERLGCRIGQEENTLLIDCRNMDRCEINGPEAVRIRSSILFLGALLGKMGRAVLPYPGGCAIGARPIDLHLCALKKLGAQFGYSCERESTGCSQKDTCLYQAVQSSETSGYMEEASAYVHASCDSLRGSRISLAYPSVGATENIILAAVMADGVTLIRNAAREPEIDELCAFLNLRGAEICRLSDGSIRIRGVKQLHPVQWTLRSDRIVTGTYLMAVMAAGGYISIRDAVTEDLQSVLCVLKKMGAHLECTEHSLCLESDGRYRAVPYLETAPYPGFPTDLQSPLTALLCRADGMSVICEKVFESRFRTAKELIKMGACIRTDRCCAKICGNRKLHGAVLEAPDLRGGAALVTAALAAEGKTQIYQMEYIERGYENICRDLSLLGAQCCAADTED